MEKLEAQGIDPEGNPYWKVWLLPQNRMEELLLREVHQPIRGPLDYLPLAEYTPEAGPQSSPEAESDGEPLN